MAKTVTFGSLTLGVGEARIAVPVLAGSPADVEEQWGVAARAGADLIEWRIDASPAASESLALELRERFGLPVLATTRTAEEGGGFRGSADEYAALVLGAARWAEAVDIEQDRPGALDLLAGARASGAAVVMSHHVFDRPVDAVAIQARLSAMAEAGADVAKIAWMVSTEAEAKAIRGVQEWAAASLPVPAVVIGMGQAGAATRLGESARLSAFTFAVGSRASAPGQLSVAEVRASL